MAKARIVIQKERVEAFRAMVVKCKGDFLVSASITKEEKGREVPASNYYPVVFSIEADDNREIFELGVQWGKELERSRDNG